MMPHSHKAVVSVRPLSLFTVLSFSPSDKEGIHPRTAKSGLHAHYRRKS